MQQKILAAAVIYLVLISAYAVFITVSDKKRAKARERRISERHLMLTGLFGGAGAMYLTMKRIRHKTKHKKFMVGLPLIIFLHCAAVFFLIFLQRYT